MTDNISRSQKEITLTITLTEEVAHRMELDLGTLAGMLRTVWEDESGKADNRVADGYNKVAQELSYARY